MSTFELSAKMLYKNNLIENIYEACSCCYDNTKTISYLEKKEYVGKRVAAGHESILEHGRMAMLFRIPSKYKEEMIDIMGLEYSKWLDFYTAHLEDDNYNMIINGSVRGYKYFLNRVTENDYETNIIIRYMINLLTEYSVKELYGTNFFLHEGYKEEVLNFVDAEPYVLDIETPRNGIQYDTIINRVIEGIATNSEPDCKQITLGVDADPLAVSNEFDIIEELLQSGFYANIAYNIIPVAVVFRNMSRTATHQLVRHRNAITQESQRYVPAENATFTIPVPEYTDEKEYTVDIFGKKTTVPLTVLATQLTKIYEQLRKQGLKKEEARAFLPANINCGRLYMTFTLSNMLAFLNLRTDPHAQFEIRRYAETIKEVLQKLELVVNY